MPRAGVRMVIEYKCTRGTLWGDRNILKLDYSDRCISPADLLKITELCFKKNVSHLHGQNVPVYSTRLQCILLFGA